MNFIFYGIRICWCRTLRFNQGKENKAETREVIWARAGRNVAGPHVKAFQRAILYIVQSRHQNLDYKSYFG